LPQRGHYSESLTDKNADKLHLTHGIQELNFYENVYEKFTNNSRQYLESGILPFARYLMNLFLAHKEFGKLKEFSELHKSYYELILKEIQSKDQEIQVKNQEIQARDREIRFIRSSKFWKLINKYLPTANTSYSSV